MKSRQFGLIAACSGLVFALCLGALWLGLLSEGASRALYAASAPQTQAAQAPATDELPLADVAAVQAVALAVTATVGTQSGACATTTTAYVLANTTVYYCYRVHNIGDETLTVHRLQSSRGDIDRELSSFSLTANQIREVRSINNDGVFLTDTTSVDVTNFVTWTASTNGGAQAIDTTRAFINVVAPALRVTKSVGQERTICPTAQNLRVPSGQNVAFCISLQNTGDMTFTQHTVVDQFFSINSTFNYTLAPGATLNIIPTNLGDLGINGSLERTNVATAFANSATVTSRSSNNLSASGASTATVEIGTTTVRFSKTVSTEEESCEGTNTITVNPGTRVYYCVQIENTGVLTLTHHELTEEYLSINLAFDYVLPPGATLRVTNGFLREINQPVVFGPFELSPRYGNVINQAMNYVGSSPDGFSVNASAGTTATFPPTPTVTNTPQPDPTRTSTPAPTSTPTVTFTPTPVTPSPTPTNTPETPTPTPTISYAITRLETPTPRGQVAGVPQQDPFQSPLFTPDPQQLPVQDPVLATATQMAVDVTSTAIAAQATAQSVPPGALQPESPLPGMGPESPLATPTVDPALSPASNPGELPVAPGVVPLPSAVPTLASPLATPTVMPSAPSDNSVPSDDITVLPPVETVVIATMTPMMTPAVVVLVVTNTPEPDEVMAAEQRPIEYPTPTATPDYVMAAARTVDVAVATFGWLWFLVGSLIFFVTAGVVAGLFFRQSEANRFDLPASDYWLEDAPTPPRDGRGARDDEEWPADLP